MNKKELNDTASHYAQNLKKGLDSVSAVDWGSKESQYLRFKILAEIADLNQKSVLDIGCGLGEFFNYTKTEGIEINYSGLDICPDMIQALKKRFPEANTQTRNILEEGIETKYDYVVSSGIFNRKSEGEIEYTKEIMKIAYEACTQGLALNMLSTKADLTGIAAETRLSDPDYWFNYAQTLTPRVTLRHDYLRHDFTLYLYKNDTNKA